MHRATYLINFSPIGDGIGYRVSLKRGNMENLDGMEKLIDLFSLSHSRLIDIKESTMSFEILLTECFSCDRTFPCNPDLVPSVRDDAGVRQPICKDCHAMIRANQINLNIPVWPLPHPEAYKPKPSPY